jgi:SM-20-related protein
MTRQPPLAIETIARQLAGDGYIVVHDPQLRILARRLLGRCQNDPDGRFHPAGIGRGAANQRVDSLRGDLISWFELSDPVDRAYLAWMEALRRGLNAALFLGLFDYECHYAIYGVGAGYARHTDVLNGARPRLLSTVFYLNDGWQEGDGGQLRLFEPAGDGVVATIQPAFGTLVIFLSDTFPHQVLTATRPRRSIAGWFRGRE